MITTKHKYTSYLKTEWDIILHAIPIAGIEIYRNYEQVCYYLEEFKQILQQII